MTITSGMPYVWPILPFQVNITFSSLFLYSALAGHTVDGLDFGDFRAVRFQGTAFDDSDSNGFRDPHERGQPGRIIQLDLESDGVIDRATLTDALGQFVIDAVGPGTHTVREVDRQPFTKTYPAGDGTHSVVTISGLDVTGLDFGNTNNLPSLPAVVRGNEWHLRNSLTTGPADTVFTFGRAGDTPVFGDWNGDGVKTPGVFRDGTWFLRNSNSSGIAEIKFTFGLPGDRPIVGDWDGDGIDTPGVVRHNRWYLRNSNSGGFGEMVFTFGVKSDVPIVGDWDGDGTDTPGVVRRDRWWFLRNSNSTGVADVMVDFGVRGIFPLAGDWDGDGVDTPLAVRKKRTSVWWLYRNDHTTAPAEDMFDYGIPGDRYLTWSAPLADPPNPEQVDLALADLQAGTLEENLLDALIATE